VSRVFVARRIGAPSYLATVKLSNQSTATARYAREAEVLRALQVLDADVRGDYYSRLLPEVVAQGVAQGGGAGYALILRHPSGYWGSLAELNERFAGGIDPRHAVWIWRRILEMLNFVHSHGWSHGDIRPEHALVHPRDHGIRLIGWASARPGISAKEQGADLSRSARVAQALLCGTGTSGVIPGTVPPGLVQLVNRAATDEEFCRSQGAAGLDSGLRAEAKMAFGPPSFVTLTV
jgi:serine/threonine protein kinase